MMKSEKKKSLTVKAKKPASFPIAAFGASAGGLEAFTSLLESLDCNLGIAYVFIMHLSPHHKSSLCEILQTKTKMKVYTATNGMKVLPDNLYVIPPNVLMSLIDGHLKLAPRGNVARIRDFAVDYFFSTLASIYKNNSIGVVLSGSATDGTLGLKAIKAEGGITFAQDDTAKFPGMPKSAYDSGYADFVLSPQNIAKEIARLVQIPYSGLPAIKIAKKYEEHGDSDAPILAKILLIVKAKTGVDFFAQYKQAMIYRRVLRRVALHKCRTLEEYRVLLEFNDMEVNELYNDFLINVSGFFRSPDFFKTLEKQVFPALVKKRNPTDPIRIWIAGCASGEEAYSVAICLTEFLESNSEDVYFKIFASDLDAQAIEKARLGIYTRNELQNVPQKQITRYFKRIDQRYQIEKTIRELCIFSQHNLLTDPPFSRIDLISCQNVLIYLEPNPQQSILRTFHYALKPTGYLFLGGAETIGAATDLFDPLDKKIRVYARKTTSATRPQFSNSIFQPDSSIIATKSITPHPPNIEEEMSKLLLESYVSPSLVLNNNLNVIQFYGVTAPYLEPPAGKASLNVLKMVRRELLIDLRVLIAKARKTGAPVSKEHINITQRNGSREIKIEVVPKKRDNEPFFLVVFKEKSIRPHLPVGKRSRATSDQKSKIITQLQGELQQSREVIQTTNEEYETTYEDLQGHAEELLSSNEELQSVNEELETSKEELQSTNEELTTINEELEKRNVELRDSQNYAKAVTDTVNSPFLVLSSNLHIRSANSSFYKTFKLTAVQTTGRYIFEIAEGSWNIPIVRKSLNAVLENKSSYLEFELNKHFPGAGELALIVNIHKVIPQDTSNDFLILLAFVNVSDAVKSNRELKRINDHLLEFTFGASHDLQEPLRKVITYANLLSDAKSSKTNGDKYLGKINSAVERMSKLVRATVEYSRLLKDNLHEFQPVDLNKTVKDICKDLELMIEEKHTTINVDLLPTVKGEPVLMHQLFYNVIKNALQFGGPNHKIAITCEKPALTDYHQHHLKKGRHYVAILVGDNGIGFDQKYAKTIFSIYQRLDESKQVKSAGMGLSICKKIAEDHDGAIFARGVKDKGATFTILLPTP